MTNEETDTALILEGELKRRVKDVVAPLIALVVKDIVEAEMKKHKAEMMMELSINIGKTLQVIEKEGRKPLWESSPEEFGLTREELNRSSIRRLDDVQNFNDAINKDTNYALRK